MKKNVSKERQGRWFTFVLYPQCNAHVDILNYLLDEKVQAAQGFKVAGMTHDRCIYSDGVKKGLPKKAHMHIIMKTETKHTGTAIAKMMGGQRAVLRLYQRDIEHEHGTTLSVQAAQAPAQPAQAPAQPAQAPAQPAQAPAQPAQPKQVVNRTFTNRTGAEYPVLVDMGYDELQPVDIDVTPDIWALIESTDGHHWDSLPEVFYNNPNYPQFKCEDNQYWKLVKRQDLSHAEVISDPKAYYLYLQHRDLASVRNQKTPYDENEFFGNEELLAELRGERGLRYQIGQLIEYFNAYGVTNGKQAYEALLYGDCTEELLKFYWNNTSKFSSYFRGMELELKTQIKEDENEETDTDYIPDPSINQEHKRLREQKEYFESYNEDIAKYLVKEYKQIIAQGDENGSFDSAQQDRLSQINYWFAIHPDYKYKLHNPGQYDEALFNAQLSECMTNLYQEKTQSVNETTSSETNQTTDSVNDSDFGADHNPIS